MSLHNQAIATALRVARQMRADGGRLPSSDTLFVPSPPTKELLDKHSRIESVPLNKAKATQSKMEWNKFNSGKYGEPLAKGYEKHPIAVRKKNGEYLIYDGHHRTVLAKNSGESHLPMHVIDADKYAPESAGRVEKPTRWSNDDDDLLRQLTDKSAKAFGGSMTTTITHEGPGAFMGNHVQKHVGPIKSAVAGRTDHLPMHVPHGAYVIPADIISAMGEGNTAAGFKHMDYIFGGTPYEGGKEPYNQPGTPYGARMPSGHAAGGAAGAVPIVAAGGEYVLSPEQVMHAGNGDLNMGHRVLDEFVKRKRLETIKTLKALPGPRRD